MIIRTKVFGRDCCVGPRHGSVATAFDNNGKRLVLPDPLRSVLEKLMTHQTVATADVDAAHVETLRSLGVEIVSGNGLVGLTAPVVATCHFVAD